MVLIVNASIPIFWDSQLAYLGTNTFWYIPSQREWEILLFLGLAVSSSDCLRALYRVLCQPYYS